MVMRASFPFSAPAPFSPRFAVPCPRISLDLPRTSGYNKNQFLFSRICLFAGERYTMAEKKFEAAMARLEEIVQELEKGDVPLEQSLKLFEEGIKLSRICNKRLEEAERKVEILMKDENGGITAGPFEEEE
jgi:exodeoxyribonuclease VII small subunit